MTARILHLDDARTPKELQPTERAEALAIVAAWGVGMKDAPIDLATERYRRQTSVASKVIDQAFAMIEDMRTGPDTALCLEVEFVRGYSAGTNVARERFRDVMLRLGMSLSDVGTIMDAYDKADNTATRTYSRDIQPAS